jgi:uncharacterized membrane protein
MESQGSQPPPRTRDRENGAEAPQGSVARNVAAVAALEAAALAGRTWPQRMADRVARLAGTPRFAALHLAWFAAWLWLNTRPLPFWRPFDPYPFNFLTLVVSLEAIFLTIFVLISQNTLTRQADLRARLDLQINLLAEQESTRTVDLLVRIARHLGVPGVQAQDEGDLGRPTDIQEVLTTLERTRPDPASLPRS